MAPPPPPAPAAPAAAEPRRSLLVPVLLAVVAVLGLQVSQHADWLQLQVFAPSLPPHWVRPATAQGESQCQQLFAVAADARARDGQQRTEFCEDVELLHGSPGWALLSCDPGRGEWNTVMGPLKDPAPRGALWTTKLDSLAQPKLLPLQGYPESATFHPLGTAYLPASDAQPGRLFVVNHAEESSAIEVFDMSLADGEWRATYVRSLRSPVATHSPNGLAALGRNELLVSQDHLFVLRPPPLKQFAALLAPRLGPLAEPLARLLSSPARHILPRLETVLGLPLGWVSHVSFVDEPSVEPQASVVASRIPFANGISLSPQGSVLAVASTMTPAVKLFRPARNAAGKPDWSRPLQAAGEIHVPQGCDNIAFSAPEPDQPADSLFDGARLLVTGHPSGLRLIRFARNPRGSVAAGSWIVDAVPKSAGAQLSPDTAPLPAQARALKANEAFTVRTIYQSERGQAPGTPSSAGSDWARDGNASEGTLIMGGLYGGVSVCHSVGL